MSELEYRQCNYIIKKGARTGERCDKKCVISERCYSHNENRMQVLENENLEKQYINLSKKIESVILRNQRAVIIHKKQCKEINRRIIGIEIFLKRRDSNIKHIQFTGKHRSHAKESIETLIKRKKRVKRKIEHEKQEINKLNQVKEILVNN